MNCAYVKKASKTPATGEDDTRQFVASMLAEIEAGDKDKAREYAPTLDHWDGDIVLTDTQILAAADGLSQQVKYDIEFAYQRVRTFAE